MTYRDDLEAAHARIAILERQLGESGSSVDAEKAHLVEELAAARRETDKVRSQLGYELEVARRETAQARDELARSRTECAGYVERIRVLQDERSKRAAAQSTASKTAILERGAKPICPHCQARGQAVSLLRDAQLTASICPQCTAVTLLR